MAATFQAILLQFAFSEADANTCAEIFTANSVDGVYTHGVNRFPTFVKMVAEGHVIPGAKPHCVHASTSLEQWDGALGPGLLNAVKATERAVELARQSGIACVALANTNHWMRGGYYGWLAAQKGCAFIGWSNTIANMPAYGAKTPALGNNPVVVALPYGTGAVVLDMALSQFSYGTLHMAAMKGEELPEFGGYDLDGRLTKDPAAIIETGRTASIGFWKGAGLSLLLDMVAAVLSGGRAVHQISNEGAEKGLSQVFVTIDLKKLHHFQGIEACLQEIIKAYKASGEALRFPGEKVAQTREQNQKNGIPVLESVWNTILSLKRNK